MQTRSSAKRTWSALRSAVEYTATVGILSARHARMIRTAISPRLAIKTFFTTGFRFVGSLRAAPIKRAAAHTQLVVHFRREFLRHGHGIQPESHSSSS